MFIKVGYWHDDDEKEEIHKTVICNKINENLLKS